MSKWRHLLEADINVRQAEAFLRMNINDGDAWERAWKIAERHGKKLMLKGHLWSGGPVEYVVSGVRYCVNNWRIWYYDPNASSSDVCKKYSPCNWPLEHITRVKGGVTVRIV